MCYSTADTVTALGAKINQPIIDDYSRYSLHFFTVDDLSQLALFVSFTAQKLVRNQHRSRHFNLRNKNKLPGRGETG